jgi:hypothetical protein
MRLTVLISVRGEGAARGAQLLALLVIGVSVGTGCRRPEIIDSGPHAVRVESLLTLHPAWEQIVSLDRTISQFTTPPPLSGMAAPDLPPMPTLLPPLPAVPPTAPQQRQQRTLDYETQYLQQLAQTLRLQDETYLTRLAKRLTQESEAQYQKELAGRIASIRAERVRRAEVLDRQIRLLSLRDVAFQTQLRVYTGQAYDDALLQDKQLQAQIAALSKEADDLVSQDIISGMALEALKTRLQELKAQAERQVEQERQALEARRADRVKKEQGKLTYEPEPLPSIDTMPLPPADSRETPLNVAPGVQAPAAMQSADTLVKQAVERQQSVWQAQRERLLTVIRADTQQAVAQIARQRGWKLVPVGTPRAHDETDTVRPLLRAQWQQARQE